MSDKTKPPSSASDLMKNFLLYHHYQAQQEAVLRHKQVESGKIGHDIGFERALTNWTLKHRSEWLKSWQGEGHVTSTRIAQNWSGGMKRVL